MEYKHDPQRTTRITNRSNQPDSPERQHLVGPVPNGQWGSLYRVTGRRELFEDGSVIEQESLTLTTVRKTYPQQWTAYNAAQTSEKEVLQGLLHELCKAIPEATEARMGRPRLPIRDGIFCAVFKVYSQLSSRRFTSDLCDAQAKGHISRVPH